MLYVFRFASATGGTDSETFTVADPFAQNAYNLAQQLGLHTYANGNYYTNGRGAGEKYLLGNGNGLYFLLPNGALYCWNGSIAGSTLVATLSPDYYANPVLLYQAQSPAAISAAGSTSAIRAVENVAMAGVAQVGAGHRPMRRYAIDRRGDGMAGPRIRQPARHGMELLGGCHCPARCPGGVAPATKPLQGCRPRMLRPKRKFR